MFHAKAFSLPVLFLITCFSSCSGEDRGSGDDLRLLVEREVAACLDRQDWAAARERLDRLEPVLRKEPWALRLRGGLFLRSQPGGGDEKAAVEAERLYREVLDKDPHFSEVRLDLARLLSGRGRRVEAVKILEAGRRLCSEDALFCFELSRVYLASAEVAGALKSVREGLELAPSSPEGLSLFGHILCDRCNRLEEGLAFQRRAVRLDPAVKDGKERLAAALVNQAIIKERQGGSVEALALLDEALDLVPADAGVLFERARIRLQAGDLDGGVEDLRVLHREGEADDEVKSLLAKSLKKLGYQNLYLRKRDKALALFREVVELDVPGVELTAVKGILEEDRRCGEKSDRKK